MAYRLAIAISGAVSLGSYEAGVVYEIVSAISQHNLNNKDNPENHIVIDVLSGASAGGMTAAMLSQKLLFEKETLQDPYNNVLYNAWVKQVDIEPLLSNQFKDDPKRSLLSSNFIDHMAEKILIDRYNTPSPKQSPHPAAAQSILLGLAMSNLNGVDYSVDAFKNASLEDETGQFVQTRYQDSFTRSVNKDLDNRHTWQEIKNAARGCGAFPAAFAPVKLERDYSEPDYFGKAKAFAKTAFTYVDGGTFNNYPLGTAKNLVDKVDTHPLDYQSRFYLYISPNSKVSTKTDVDGDTASIFATSSAISSAIFNQARFQDWMLTSKFNKLLDQFSDRATALGEHLTTLSTQELRALSQACDLLLDKIFDADQNRDQNSERNSLHLRFKETDTAKNVFEHSGQAGLDAWIKALHVLEAGGRLGGKNHMPIYTITAKTEELASDGLFAFVGFLESKFREHDYNVGRKKARAFLHNLKRINECERGEKEHHLPLKDFTFTDEIPEMEDLGSAGITDVNKGIRKKLYKRNHERLDLWFKQAGMSSVLRWLLLLFINKQAKKFLHL